MTVGERLLAERTRLRTLILAAGGAAVVALAALVLGAGTAVLGGARWISLPAAAPFVVWVLVLGAAAAGGVWTVRRLRRSAAPRDLAAAVERERALRAGSLRGALEVSGSGALARRAEERLAAQLATVRGPLAPELRGRHLRDGAIAAGGALAAALVLVLVAWRAPDGWAAIAHPVRAMSGTLLPPLVIADAPRQAMRGEPLSVTVQAPARQQIVLRWRRTGAGWQESRQPVVDGEARVALGVVDADLHLVASDGRATSDTAFVQATDRPFLGDVSMRAFYPAYLGRPDETLPLGEPARVPRGTLLQLRGAASTPLEEVVLAPTGAGDTLRLGVEGRQFFGRVPVAGSGRWTWRARGAHGVIPEVPPALEIVVGADSAPVATIVAPARNLTVLPTDRVPLSLAATDDHGVGQVVLRTWRVRDGVRGDESVRQVAAPGAPQWDGTAELNLGAFGLEVGDEVHAVLVATDQSPWRQSGESRELVLRVPRLDEQRSQVRDAADSLVAQAVAAASRQQSLARQADDAARSRDRSTSSGSRGGGSSAGGRASASPPMSYESAERAKSIAQEQRKLAGQVQQMQDQAKQLERQLRQAGALDSALQDRLREAQRLMQEALTPELAAKLQALEQSAQGLNEEQTRQALADLAEQQRRMREQLERSVEMLRRAALEGAMETLRDEAQDLAKEQQQLGDSLARGAQQRATPRDAGTAEQLAARSEELARDVERLRQRLAEQQAKQGAERAGEAAEHAKASAERLQQSQRGEQRGEQQGAQARAQQGAQSERARQQAGAQQSGAQREQRAAGEQGGEKQAGEQQREGAQAGAQQRSGQQQGGQQGGQQGAGQQQAGAQAQAAHEAAGEMQQAADDLASARQQQVDAWKSELTSELDRSINEMMNLAREQQRLEQQARQGTPSEELRGAQSAVQQGVQRAGQRLEQAGQKSSLLSPRSQQAVADAQRRVEQAAQAAGQAQGGGSETAAAMQAAAQSLNQAAASLVRDRDRANNANSASGFSDMIREMQQLAQQQGQVSQQAQGLVPQPGRGIGAQARDAARKLGRQQRDIARELDGIGDADGSGRTAAMAQEARQLAQALESGAVDASVVNRQQRLFRRMLDAGRTLEQDERDESGRREAQAAVNPRIFTPPGDTSSGANAMRYRVPTWNELRGLSPEERRLVVEYFRRLNAEP